MYWAQDLDETDQEKVDQLVREGGYRMYDAFQALAVSIPYNLNNLISEI